jgi:glycosyltransferase involved in cell wall biosynthesis
MITAIMSTYNEINFLPLKINWCRKNNLSLYVCDNISNDGTWELLQKENIPSHQYDSNEMFSETLMQKEIKTTLKQLSPEWVLYMGCDMFFDIPENYKDYDYISFYYYAPKNTGEELSIPFNPFITYHYAVPCGGINFLFKYSENVIFNADEIIIPGIGMHNRTLALNYGDTKSKEERESTKLRKQKAWDNGESTAWGSHYITGSSIEWTWDKSRLTNMKNTHHWPTILKIANDCDLT